MRGWWPTSQLLVVVTAAPPADPGDWFCRDVIDAWRDDEAGVEDMDARVEGLRRALSDLRQWKVDLR